jgi:hypothetical protein
MEQKSCSSTASSGQKLFPRSKKNIKVVAGERGPRLWFVHIPARVLQRVINIGRANEASVTGVDSARKRKQKDQRVLVLTITL